MRRSLVWDVCTQRATTSHGFRHQNCFGTKFALPIQNQLQEIWLQRQFRKCIWYDSHHICPTEHVQAGERAFTLDDGHTLYNEDQLSKIPKLPSPDDQRSVYLLSKEKHDFRHVNFQGTMFPLKIQLELHPVWLKRGFCSCVWYYHNMIPKDFVKSEETAVCAGDKSLYNKEQLHCIPGSSDHIGKHAPSATTMSIDKHHFRHHNARGRSFPFPMQEQLHKIWLQEKFKSFKWIYVNDVRPVNVRPGQTHVAYERCRLFNEDQLFFSK